MSSVASQDTASTTSPHSRGSIHEEDWDRSESEIQPDGDLRTPRNSVLFPADGGPDLSPRKGGRRGNRTLSELLKLYAEKGTDCQFSQEEATRIADVLGQWVRLPPFLLALRVSAEKPIRPLFIVRSIRVPPLTKRRTTSSPKTTLSSRQDVHPWGLTTTGCLVDPGVPARAGSTPDLSHVTLASSKHRLILASHVCETGPCSSIGLVSSL